MALTKEQFIADFKDMALKMYAAPLEDLSSQQLYQALALLTRTYIAQPWADTTGLLLFNRVFTGSAVAV